MQSHTIIAIVRCEPPFCSPVGRPTTNVSHSTQAKAHKIAPTTDMEKSTDARLVKIGYSDKIKTILAVA